MKRKLIVTIALTLSIVFGIGSTSFNLAVKAANNMDTTDKRKVHIKGDVMGEMGISDEDVANAFEEIAEEEGGSNIEFVAEKSAGVEEITIVMQVDDSDDDNDGIADAKDTDDDGDGVADDKEIIGDVDLDKTNPELLKELKDDDASKGMIILIEANDKQHHIIKLHTKADPPAEETINSFNHAFKKMNARSPFIPKWLKTTFKVVVVAAKVGSCLSGSIGSCISLTAQAYAK